MTTIQDHFRDGDGEPLLLVHGFSATWRIWGAVPELLAADHDVFAPTLPGHTGGPALSTPPTVDALADALESMMDEVGWRRAHIAGFSLGGWLGLELAKRGRALSVIALSPGGAHARAGERESTRIAKVFRRGWWAARAATPLLRWLSRSAFFRRAAMRDMMVHGDRLEPATAASTIRSFAKTPLFNEILQAMGDSGGLTGLDRIEVPVHLVWGERDRVLPVRHSPFFTDAIEHATFHVVPGAGHVPFWDAPHEFVEQIRRGVREGARSTLGTSRAN